MSPEFTECVTRPIAPALTQLRPEPACKHKHWHVLAFEHLDCPFRLSFRRLRGTLWCQIIKVLGRHWDETISSGLGFRHRFFSSGHLEVTWQLSDQWARIDHFQLKPEGPHDFSGIQILQLLNPCWFRISVTMHVWSLNFTKSCTDIGASCWDAMSAAREWHLVTSSGMTKCSKYVINCNSLWWKKMLITYCVCKCLNYNSTWYLADGFFFFFFF